MPFLTLGQLYANFLLSLESRLKSREFGILLDSFQLIFVVLGFAWKKKETTIIHPAVRCLPVFNGYKITFF